MGENWDEYAADWDGNEAVIQYADKAFKTLLEAADLSGIRVLDFGCGTGLLTERIARYASCCVALDPCEKMLAVLAAKKLENVAMVADQLSQELLANNVNLQSGFDLIVASSALGFVPDYPETLKLLTRLLNNRGQLLQWDWLKEDEVAGSGFSKPQLDRELQLAGFTEYTIYLPFSVQTPAGTEKVIMAVATKT